MAREGSLHGWLLRIAVNRALRAVKQRPRLFPLEDGAGELPEISGGSEPLAHLLTAERDRLVQEAVASLPDPYRETIVLRYFGELSIAEIASVTHWLVSLTPYTEDMMRRLAGRG
jgi:DNA-directed RNA polymerase specialized sigma24 family protein